MTMLNRTHDRALFASVCARSVAIIVVGLGVMVTTGCQDGPLYALKAANPYFSMREWKEDELIGPTDHKRRHEMMNLAASMKSLPRERQTYWISHLEQVMKNDQSVEMRRLAVNAAGHIDEAAALSIIQDGLKDESTKVRMEACRALSRQKTDESARLLAETLGSETETDVRHAAMESLATYKTPIAVDALRVALADRNPATRSLAVSTLRDSTGKDYGDDPQVWIAVLDGKTPEPAEEKIAQRIMNLF